MKKIALALMAALLLSHCPAEAATKGKLYKTYHMFVYYPVMAVCFLLDAPVMIVSHVNQHFDDLMKDEADQEAAEQPVQ